MTARACIEINLIQNRTAETLSAREIPQSHSAAPFMIICKYLQIETTKM